MREPRKDPWWDPFIIPAVVVIALLWSMVLGAMGWGPAIDFLFGQPIPGG